MGVDAQMLVRNPHPLRATEVRALAADLFAAFGRDALSVAWPGEWDSWPNGRHALEIVNEYTQDGDTLTPKAGEQFIEVHLYGRYYGEGYERGPLWDFIGIAEWLEARIPFCAVWYGGDSGGICAAPFDADRRRELAAYFANVGHSPYVGSGEGTVRCGFCERAMVQMGWGGGSSSDALFYCTGCGKHVAREGGEFFPLARNQEWSEWRQQQRERAAK